MGMIWCPFPSSLYSESIGTETRHQPPDLRVVFGKDTVEILSRKAGRIKLISWKGKSTVTPILTTARPLLGTDTSLLAQCAYTMSLGRTPYFPGMGPVSVVVTGGICLECSHKAKLSACSSLGCLTFLKQRIPEEAIQNQGKGTMPKGELSWKWVCIF